MSMFESRDACPWYQSDDLTADQAAADWERARQADGWADYVADMVERQADDDAELLALLESDEARQAGCWPVQLRQEGDGG
jgi:uncharacterized lipoprotein YddW (UPF0748 family)